MLRVTNGDPSQEGGNTLLLSKTPESEEKAALPRPQVERAPDYSSVITQVTKRDSPTAPHIHALSTERTAGPVAQRNRNQAIAAATSAEESWRSKFRFLLCCFAPETQGYVKSRDISTAVPRGVQPAMAPPMAARQRDNLIGPKRQEDLHKKTLVLDLDETLVHSSFKPIPSPDYIIPVEIDGKLVDVYVLKRPWMDHFMESVGHRYEVVVFTASLSKYADPLLDLLDKTHVVRWRLFRESCLPYEGNYVKDLACLGRELSDTIIVDNSPHSYVFQPANALPIGTFIDNMEDQELLDLLPVLQQTEFAEDVRVVLTEHEKALLGGVTGRF